MELRYVTADYAILGERDIASHQARLPPVFGRETVNSVGDPVQRVFAFIRHQLFVFLTVFMD